MPLAATCDILHPDHSSATVTKLAVLDIASFGMLPFTFAWQGTRSLTQLRSRHTQAQTCRAGLLA